MRRNHEITRRSSGWGTVFALALLFLAAACSDDSTSTQLTTQDQAQAESSVDRDRSQESTTELNSGNADVGEDADPDDTVAVDPPEAPIATAPRAESSPADRQNTQSVNGVESETVDSADEDEPVRDDSDTEEQEDEDAPLEVQPPVGPVVDVPAFPGSSQATQGQSIQTQPPGEQGQSDTGQTVTSSAVADLPPDSCGNDCDIGGIGGDDEALVDVNVDSAETFDVVDKPSPALDPVPEGSDDVCPPGSSADCKPVESSEAIATELDLFADTDPDSELTGAVEQEVTCETRPWGRGCAGPVPDYDVPEEIYVPADDPTAEPVSEGVVIPQEIQDILLQPAS